MSRRKKTDDKPCHFPDCKERGPWWKLFCDGHHGLIPFQMRKDLSQARREKGMAAAVALVPATVRAIERSLANGAKPKRIVHRAWTPAGRHT